MDNTQLCLEIKNLCEQILSKLDKPTDNVQGAQGVQKYDPNDVLLDYQDICQLLHISLRHLRRLNKEKELVGFKIGRRRFYRASEIQQYIQKVEQKKNR